MVPTLARSHLERLSRLLCGELFAREHKKHVQVGVRVSPYVRGVRPNDLVVHHPSKSAQKSVIPVHEHT